MPILHDAAGTQSWITITEENGARYLYLEGCEEGAMALASEEPVFQYLWFYRCGRLVRGPVRRALVLGAGAFTAPKCLALAHPRAAVDAVDIEGALGDLGKRYFRLSSPAFGRIRFHGQAAETFLQTARGPYDLIFDDLFDGYQHVPAAGRGRAHAMALRKQLAGGGICLKNIIWDPRSADARRACQEVSEAWRDTFDSCLQIALGEPERGHNRMLIACADEGHLEWNWVRGDLEAGGVPHELLERCRAEALGPGSCACPCQL